MILSHKKFIGKCKNRFFANWKRLKPIFYVIWGFSKWVNVEKDKDSDSKKIMYKPSLHVATVDF